MRAIAEMLSYARQRLLRARILALIAFMALAACIAVWITDAALPNEASIDAFRAVFAAAGAALLLAAVMVSALRLIDDLADLPVDRVRHPERVLVQAHSRRPFVLAAAVLALLPLVVLDGPARLAWVLLLVALLVWYRLRPATDPRMPAPDRIVLLKYPAFVLLIAGRIDSPAAWVAAALVYAVVVLVDELDRPRPGGQRQ